MKIAIVDDEKEMLDIIQTVVLEMKENVVCNVFQKAMNLLEQIEDGKQFDVYFLDVEMPQITGLDLAKHIRKVQNSAYIVFISSYEKFVLKSYDTDIKAYYYILKEQMKDKIPIVLSEISKELELRKEDYYIILNKMRYEKFKIMDIIYIYKENKNSVFVTKEGVFKERKALGIVIRDLNKAEFLFVDSGRALNIKYIKRIEKNVIFLDDEIKIYSSQINIRRLKKDMIEYWGNL